MTNQLIRNLEIGTLAGLQIPPSTEGFAIPKFQLLPLAGLQIPPSIAIPMSIFNTAQITSLFPSDKKKLEYTVYSHYGKHQRS